MSLKGSSFRNSSRHRDRPGEKRNHMGEGRQEDDGKEMPQVGLISCYGF